MSALATMLRGVIRCHDVRSSHKSSINARDLQSVSSFFFSILSKLKMASSFAYSAESQTDRVNCTLINNSSLRQYQNNRISYICVLYYRVASLIIIVSTIICTLIYVVFVDITLLVLTSLSSTLSHM